MCQNKDYDDDDEVTAHELLQIVFTVTQKNKSNTIKWNKLRNCELVDNKKKPRYLSKFKACAFTQTSDIRRNVACVAGARKRKGKGESKSGACARSDAGRGWGTEAPAANLLFISSSSFAGEWKIAIGSFLIMRQSLPDTTLSLVEMFLEALERDMEALERDIEGKFEQIFEGNRSACFARAQFPPLPSPF